MSQYVIHIGPHKTGSTYLQNALSGQRNFLAEHGVCYPADLGEIGHLLISRKLADPARHAELAAQFRRYEASADTVLLSAEDLASMREPEIAALAAIIGPQPVRIVFYCRNWASVSLSNWGEQVRHGFDTRLDDALRQRMEQPNRSPPINYGLTLGRYATAFGKHALTLVSLEALTQGSIDTVAHFANHLLGIGTWPAEVAVAGGGRNTALPLVDAEIIRALNGMRIERTGQRDGLTRRSFQSLRGLPQILATTRREAEAHIDTLVVNETMPKFQRLHERLFSEYGACLLQPHPPRAFFTPERRLIRYVRREYLDIPQVQAELETAYTTLEQTRTTPRVLVQ